MMKGECGRMEMPGMAGMARGMSDPSLDAQSLVLMRGLPGVEEEDENQRARGAILRQMQAASEPSREAMMLIQMGRNGNAY